ncbi:MAG: cysteine peptidase family C39 domain-containing protein, partial [Planctomycetota bacterium]|nr:cysteine peptidase family C39 domain-containing protein [Planctomycetota bacterium]
PIIAFCYFILLIVLSVLGFIAGQSNRLIRSRNKIGFILLRVLCLMIICGAAWLRFHPEIEYYFIPEWFALPFEIIWIFPLAIFFISAGSKLMSSRFASKCLVVLSLLVLIVGLDMSSWVIIGQRVNPERFMVDKDRVCIQSTHYTCGAASAVTLLNHYGITTNELEMARLSHTTRRGIRIVPLALAIGRKVSDYGFSTDILKLDWEELKRLNQPCIITTKFGFMVDHVVTVLEIDDKDNVWIGEPLAGRIKKTKEEFLNQWRGSAIIINTKPQRTPAGQDTTGSQWDTHRFPEDLISVYRSASRLIYPAIIGFNSPYGFESRMALSAIRYDKERG